MLPGSAGGFTIDNIIAFAIGHWLRERGGPLDRLGGDNRHTDFLSRQMSDAGHAPLDWRPTSIDYL